LLRISNMCGAHTLRDMLQECNIRRESQDADVPCMRVLNGCHFGDFGERAPTSSTRAAHPNRHQRTARTLSPVKTFNHRESPTTCSSSTLPPQLHEAICERNIRPGGVE
jgi:hypothetical protein